MLNHVDKKNMMQASILNDDQCYDIIQTAFRVLERTGCNVHHEAALKLLKDAGCKVDGIHVNIPTYLVERAIRSAPSQIMLYDREGNPALHLGGRNGNKYFVTGVENLYRIDMRTGERRPTTMRDAAEAALVIDAMPNIDLATGLACISDCTEELAGPYETKMVLENTTKPFSPWAFDLETLKTGMELCAAVAGGMDKFVEKPFIFHGAAASTPLTHSEEAVGKLLYLFEKGIPSMCVGAAMMGGTGPMTIAGSFVVATADSLVGLLLSQLVREGAPFIGASFPDVMDMQTMGFSMTSPEWAMASTAASQLWKFLDIPCIAHIGATDSPVFDQQAAFDIGVQLYNAALMGGHMNYFAGYLETAMSSSLEALVFANEAIGYARNMVKGIEVNTETLAEEVIHSVGPHGNYTAEEHTAEHFREHWFPTDFVRTSYEKWEKDGKKDFKERAREKAESIINAGPRKPLSPEVLSEMNDIMANAEKKYR